MGGAAAYRPTSPESECRGGSRAQSEPSLPPPALIALWPAGPSDKPPSDLPRPKQGPQVASPALRAPDRPPAASRAPELGALGPGRGEEREDRLPRPSRSRGLPPAPVPALPKPGPMASFIPPRALYKYLPCAHRVSGTETDAAGAQREESEAAQLSGDSHLEVIKV